MYRNIFLEFLSSKRSLLQKTSSSCMTLCLVGSYFHDSLVSLKEKNDEITVYHIKEPRIYQKKYAFDLLENTIVMMVLELKEEVCFNYNDLNFELKDPFYLKNLSDFSFSSLQATPIFKENDIIGVLITYFDVQNQKIEYRNSELFKLIESLIYDFEQSYEEKLLNKIKPENKFLYLAFYNSSIYVNDELKEYFQFSKNIVDAKSNNLKKVNSFISMPGVKEENFEGFKVYYIDSKNLKQTNVISPVYGLINLDKMVLDSDFSVIFVKILSLKSPLEIIQNLEHLMQLLGILEYQIFQYNEFAFLVKAEKISFLDFEKFKGKDVLDYFLLINSGKELSSKMSLSKVCEYLYLETPEKFVFAEYNNWLNEKNKITHYFNTNYKSTDFIYEIKNASDGALLTRCTYLPFRKGEKANIKGFYQTCESLLKEFLKEENQKILIHLPSSLLAKRKTYEIVKKILENNNILWINVLIDEEMLYADFAKLIVKYKVMNLNLACDSSVYLNYIYMPLLSMFDAFYIQDEEYKSIRKNEVGLPQAIFTYAINDRKYLIFENFKKDLSLDYNHASCYFLTKIKQ